MYVFHLISYFHKIEKPRKCVYFTVQFNACTTLASFQIPTNSAVPLPGDSNAG